MQSCKDHANKGQMKETAGKSVPESRASVLMITGRYVVIKSTITLPQGSVMLLHNTVISPNDENKQSDDSGSYVYCVLWFPFQ